MKWIRGASEERDNERGEESELFNILSAVNTVGFPGSSRSSKSA